MDDKNTKNRRLKDKVKLDSQSYETLLAMLEGNEEDVILALECLNNVNQKDSLVYTLFLRKNAKNTKIKAWESHCKKLLNFHGSLGIDSSSNIIGYNDILEIIKLSDNKEENLDFFLKVFSKFLTGTFKPIFDFVDNVELKIKVK